jgi:hypothetical protein
MIFNDNHGQGRINNDLRKNATRKTMLIMVLEKANQLEQ